MRRTKRQQGFTLLELIIVMVIVGIMATQAIYAFTNPIRKVKSAAFSLRNDINLARAEAVNRVINVVVTFLDDTDIDGDGDNDDGYRLWIDSDPAGAPDGIYTSGSDELIKQSAFDDDVQFYGLTIALPAGPDRTASNVVGWPPAWPGGMPGVTFVGNDFQMLPNGSSDNGGTVYIYAPHPDDGGAVLKTAPFAVVLNNIVGSVRLVRWRPDEPLANKWKSK